MSEATTNIDFRFLRDSDSTHEVPASLLSQTMAAAQQAIYLLAAEHERREIRSRARWSESLRRKYQLHCQLPRHGSYFMPTILAGEQHVLPSLEDQKSVADMFREFTAAISVGDQEQVFSLVGDSAIRKRLYQTFREMAPGPGSGWNLEVSSNGSIVRLGSSFLKQIRTFQRISPAESTSDTVTGRLSAIDFDAKLLKLRSELDSWEATVYYDDSQEDFLLDTRDSLIQVTGRVKREGEKGITRIDNVESIVELDLSPFRLSEIHIGNESIPLTTPLSLEPVLDEDEGQWLVLNETTISLNVFAKTRETLEAELNEQLGFLWREYVIADAEELSAGALAVRNSLRKLSDTRHA